MSDLKVTDVQKIIRTFAASGHDITQSPRHLHVDGKPYGMVIGHAIGISSSQNWAYVHSYIMQTERPLVTQIFSVNDNTKKYDGATRRGVRPSIRYTHLFDDDSVSHNYIAKKNPLNIMDDDYLGHYGESLDRGGLWTPHGSFYPHKDIHEAIQSHTSSKISHMGVLNNKDNIESEMTPKEHSSFNDHEALSKFTHEKPFSGLVHVSIDGNSSYAYNPDTEELHKHDSYTD